MGYRTEVAGLFFLLASRLMAQAPLAASAVRGTVLDPQNRPVPRAGVTLTQKPRGLQQQAESDQSGSFLFPFIEPGTYAVRVTKDGFSPYEIADFTVALGQLAALEINLQIGDFHNAIVISASAQIDTQSNTTRSVVDSKRVEKLPLDGRNFLQ